MTCAPISSAPSLIIVGPKTLEQWLWAGFDFTFFIIFANSLSSGGSYTPNHLLLLLLLLLELMPCAPSLIRLPA